MQAVLGVPGASLKATLTFTVARLPMRRMASTFSLHRSKQRVFAPADTEVPLPEGSVRTGVVALKCGMTCDYNEWGERFPLTVLKLENVQVTQIKEGVSTKDKDSVAMQVAGGDAPLRSITKPLAGHFRRAGVSPKRVLAEFRVTPDALLPVGASISAAHFVPGQFVAVCGISQGKGFQGGMRRWGFAGQPASHGVSKTHRSLGSTGACQDPGRTWKGKKMAGRMGGQRRTVPGLQVYKIDVKRDLVYVKGAVPGTKGSYVRITDCNRLIPRKRHKGIALPPFPTAPPSWLETIQSADWDASDAPPFEWVAPPTELDPFAIHESEEGEG